MTSPFKGTKHVWVTKDGRRIRVKDMTPNHLQNTYHHLLAWAKRKLESEIHAGWGCLGFMNGEMAQMAIEQDINSLYNTTPEEYLDQHVKTWRAIEARWERVRSGKEKVEWEVWI